MPLVAAAFCPHPPMIVPEVAAGAAAELDDLRAACDAAVARLVASGARTVVVIGGAERTADLDPPYRGSFAPWGLPLRVGAGDPSTDAGDLPLSLLVGAWLLERVPRPTRPGARMTTVGHDEPVSRCADVGARIDLDHPWAALVMGDGSACRGEKAPGHHDPRAGVYDERVAAALAGVDVAALLDLDPALSAELRVAGRAPWQVVAGAVRAAGGDWHGELTHHGAPYGVGYLVAQWARDGLPRSGGASPDRAGTR